MTISAPPTARLVHVPVTSAYATPLHVYDPAMPARGAVVVLPALGLAARFYRPLAQALAAIGFFAVVLEPRGHGDSPWRPDRHCNYGFAEWIREDIPAAVNQARLHSDKPVVLGHSLGGHLAAMFAADRPEAVGGLVLSACGSPWRQAYALGTRLRVDFLRHFVIPLSGVMGYYPGDRVGFGGREARRLMQDWSALARTNRYRAYGIDIDYDAALRDFSAPVLVMRYADDPYAPLAAVAAVQQKLHAAPVSHIVLDEQQLGAAANHHRWVRQPRAPVDCVHQWMQSNGLIL